MVIDVGISQEVRLGSHCLLLGGHQSLHGLPIDKSDAGPGRDPRLQLIVAFGSDCGEWPVADAATAADGKQFGFRAEEHGDHALVRQRWTDRFSRSDVPELHAAPQVTGCDELLLRPEVKAGDSRVCF